MTYLPVSVLKHSLILIVLCIVANSGVDASCRIISTLIKCTDTMITDAELANADNANDLHVQNYHGQLATQGNSESELNSIQLQGSNITHIQPKFFYQFTNGNLKYLILNRVAGNFRLNSETLAGLEKVLLRLEVNDHELQDMGDIGNFEKLQKLKLVRTGITKMPRGFGRIVPHLEELDVSNNNLTWLPWEALANRLENSYSRSLRVGNNPWHCDCRMKPLVTASIQAKRKVSGLNCASPPELAGQKFDTLKVEDICTAPLEPEVKDPSPDGGTEKPVSGKDETSGEAESSGKGGVSTNTDQGQGEAVIASAGSSALSTEIIAVIVAVCVIVVVIISAVIAYKVRQRNARRKTTGGKGSTFQSNAYCAVVENPEEGRMKHPSKLSHHDVSEREPLAGTGYNSRYPDPRL